MEATAAVDPANRWSRVDLLSGVVAVAAAIALPVQSTASWLHPTYTATRADVVQGVWILKVTVVAIAVAAMVLARYRDASPSAEARVAAPMTPSSWLILSAVILLALGLRLYRIDTELWLDEVLLRVRYTPLEFRQLISTYDSQNHQPFYSIMSRIAFLAVGGSDWSIRIPAVGFGIASLVALYWFGRQVTSTMEATLGTLILAVSYHHVWFSQNARGYTAVLLFAVLGTGVFLKLWQGTTRPGRLAWTYAMLLALATYTQVTAAFLAVGHAMTLLAMTRWNSREARQLATWPLIAIGLSAMLAIGLYALILPQVWREVTEPTMKGIQVEWTATGWLLREGVRVLARGIPGGLFTVVAGVAVLAVGVSSYWRQARRATLLMYAPVAITLVVIVGTRHNLWPRFFFFAAGFLVLTAVRGGVVLVRWVVRAHYERVAVAGACGVAALSLLTVPRAWQPKQQFRAAYEFVERERQPGDAVAAVDAAGYVYMLRGWGPWRIANSLSRIVEIERTAPRTWIVFTLPARVRAMMPDLFAHVSQPPYQTVRIFPATVGGGELHVLRRDSPTRHD